MWGNYAYFLRRVMPVAKEAGVRRGMHPDDPPLPSLRGAASRASSTGPRTSSAPCRWRSGRTNGISFCQANFKLMGCDLEYWVRRFAAQGKFFFVHTVRRWTEQTAAFRGARRVRRKAC